MVQEIVNNYPRIVQMISPLGSQHILLAFPSLDERDDLIETKQVKCWALVEKMDDSYVDTSVEPMIYDNSENKLEFVNRRYFVDLIYLQDDENMEDIKKRHKKKIDWVLDQEKQRIGLKKGEVE